MTDTLEQKRVNVGPVVDDSWFPAACVLIAGLLRWFVGFMQGAAHEQERPKQLILGCDIPRDQLTAVEVFLAHDGQLRCMRKTR